MEALFTNSPENRSRFLAGIHYAILSSERAKDISPQFAWLDLSVILVYQKEYDGEGFKYVYVSNGLLEVFNISVEEAKAAAEANEAKAQYFTQTLAEVIFEITDEASSPDMEVPIYVVRNSECIYGATALLHEECFAELADKLEDDLCIIPSSIHELLVISLKEVKMEWIISTIREVNATEVDPKEVLADHPYIYYREDHTISSVNLISWTELKS